MLTTRRNPDQGGWGLVLATSARKDGLVEGCGEHRRRVNAMARRKRFGPFLMVIVALGCAELIGLGVYYFLTPSIGRAWNALNQVRRSWEVNQLAEQLSDPNTAPLAVQKLITYGPLAASPLREILRTGGRWERLFVLRNLPSAGLPIEQEIDLYLDGTQAPEERSRAFAAGYLVGCTRRNPDNTPFSAAQLFDRVVPLLNDHSSHVRIYATEILLNSRSSMPLTEERWRRLLDDPNPLVRVGAAGHLLHSGVPTEETRRRCLDILSALEGDHEARLIAGRAIATTAPELKPGAVKHAHALLQRPDSQDRNDGVSILAELRLGPASLFPWLVPALWDSRFETRRLAGILLLQADNRLACLVGPSMLAALLDPTTRAEDRESAWIVLEFAGWVNPQERRLAALKRMVKRFDAGIASPAPFNSAAPRVSMPN